MLAYHFHDEISLQALISPLVIIAGIVLAVRAAGSARAALWGSWGPRSSRAQATRWRVFGAGVLVAVAGLYGVVEVPALRHNHLCHAHNSDSSLCTAKHATDRDNHTHWLGGRAAKPRFADHRTSPYSGNRPADPAAWPAGALPPAQNTPTATTPSSPLPGHKVPTAGAPRTPFVALKAPALAGA